MKIMVIGDIHGAFRGHLNPFINKQQPDMILACGDFGYWPNDPVDPSDPATDIKNHLRDGRQLCQIKFCDGNHEDHAALHTLTKGSRNAVQLAPGINYQPRGSTFTLPDGRVVLFAGGAKSVDWREREEGIDWFPSEILTADDLPDPLPAADIVISHTAPRLFPVEREDRLDPRWDSSPDPSRDVLDRVFECLRPKQWFFGHFHKHMHGEFEGCRWTALAAAQGGGRWWVELD